MPSIETSRCNSCQAPLTSINARTSLLGCDGCRSQYLQPWAHAATWTAEAPSGNAPLALQLTDGFLEQYTLDRPIGVGATGAVYLATERASGQQVAIKFLVEQRRGDTLSRFLTEGRLMQQIQHTNVVRVHTLDTTDHHPYLVSEYMGGGSLRDLIKRSGRLPPAKALHIVTEVLAGLSACHERGIVHRDLKPENILFDTDGVAKIADLGIAKNYGNTEITTMTAVGALLGTPHYMSPEQARGEPAVVASDLYATGIILYELLSGAIPFTAPNILEILDKHQSAPLPPIPDIPGGMGGRLWAVLSRALAKHIADRPNSANDMAALLRLSLERRPTSHSRSGQTSRVSTLSPPPPEFALDAAKVAGLAVLFLVSISVGWSLRPTRLVTVGAEAMPVVGASPPVALELPKNWASPVKSSPRASSSPSPHRAQPTRPQLPARPDDGEWLSYTESNLWRPQLSDQVVEYLEGLSVETRQTPDWCWMAARAYLAAGNYREAAYATATYPLLIAERGREFRAIQARLTVHGDECLRRSLARLQAKDPEGAADNYFTGILCDRALLARQDHGLGTVTMAHLSHLAEKKPMNDERWFAFGVYQYCYSELRGAESAFREALGCSTDAFRIWRTQLWLNRVLQERSAQRGEDQEPRGVR